VSNRSIFKDQFEDDASNVRYQVAKELNTTGGRRPGSALIVCPICDCDDFSFRSQLGAHRAQHHPAISAQEFKERAQRPYLCSYEGCIYRSFKLSALRVHLTVKHKRKQI